MRHLCISCKWLGEVAWPNPATVTEAQRIHLFRAGHVHPATLDLPGRRVAA